MNRWANFNQIWRIASLGEVDSSLFKWRTIQFNGFFILSTYIMIIMCLLSQVNDVAHGPLFCVLFLLSRPYDEATVSPRIGRDGMGISWLFPAGERCHKEDSTLTPGQTPFAPVTHGITLTLFAVRKVPLALQIGDLGQHTSVLASQVCVPRGLRGLLRMIGVSVARQAAHPLLRALLQKPLGNLREAR